MKPKAFLLSGLLVAAAPAQEATPPAEPPATPEQSPAANPAADWSEAGVSP